MGLSDTLKSKERLAKFCVPCSEVHGKAIPVRAWTDPLRFPEFSASRHTEVARLSALHTGRLYPPGDTYGTHSYQGHSAAERIKSKKNLNDAIGIRIRDLPAYSALPQPTEPLPTPQYTVPFLNIFLPSELHALTINCRSGCVNHKDQLHAHTHVNVSYCPISFGYELHNLLKHAVVVWGFYR